jgi:prevent-host-death family protein
MKKPTRISVTEAARNFADCVTRAHYQDQSFILVKNGKPLARLVPDGEKVCTGKQLAEALEGVELTSEEAKAWQKDLAKARKILKPPTDKWQ